MPQLAIGAVAAVAAGISAGSWIVGLTMFALSAVSFLLTPNVGSFEQRLSGLLVTQRSSVTYGRRIFGFTRVGGVITFIDSTDGDSIDNEFLHVIVTFAYHAIEEFITVYLDDIPIHIRNLDDDGFVTIGKYESRVKIQYDLGARPTNGLVPNDGLFNRDSLTESTPGYVAEADWQPFPDLQADSDLWTVNHKQMGRAKIYFQFQADTDLYNGIPNITAIVKGTNEIYDPRTGTNRWAPNGPLAVRFLVKSNPAFRCGLGADEDELDDDNFTAVANLADERVDIDPTKSLSLRGMTIITDQNLVTPDDDGKYRYFPAYLTDGVTALVAGADIQTGDGYSLIGSGDPTRLPAELTEGYGTKYYIILKQFGQSPYFDRTFLRTDGSPYTTSKNLCKDIFAIGFATSYENAINDIPIECAAPASASLPEPNWASIGAIKVDETRYQCNGVFEYDRSYSDILEEMLTSFGGRLVYSGGKYKLVSCSYVTPQYEFTKDDLVEEPRIQPKVGRRDRFNVVSGVYSSPIHNFQPSAYVSARRQQYIDDDNYTGSDISAIHILPRTLDLPFTTSPSAAQRLARIALERSRQEIVMVFPVDHRGLLVEIGDTVLITHDDLGFDQKIFEVTEMEILSREDREGNPVLGVNLTLKEHASAIFDWTPSTDEDDLPADLATNTRLQNASIVQPPTNLSVNEDLVQISSGVGLTPRVTMTWTASRDPFLDHYQVQYKLTSASEYTDASDTQTTTSVLNNFPVGNYDFRVRAVNTAGYRSAWITASKNVNGLADPPDPPQNVGIAQLSDALVLITLDLSEDLDVLFGGSLIVRHDEDNFSGDIINSVGIGSKTFPGNSTSVVVPNKTGTYVLMFRDSTGNYSTATEIRHTRAETGSYSTLATITESTTFLGSKTNLQVLAGELQLDYDTSTSPALDVVGSGTYLFNTAWSSVSAKNVRITTYIDVIIQDNLETIDDRTEPIDTWPTMDGVLGVECDARVQIRFKTGDPAASPLPSFSEWQNVDCMFANMHEAEFRVLVESDFGYANIKIGTLYVVIEEVL